LKEAEEYEKQEANMKQVAGSMQSSDERIKLGSIIFLKNALFYLHSFKSRGLNK
jgi:hypothetical protein